MRALSAHSIPFENNDNGVRNDARRKTLRTLLLRNHSPLSTLIVITPCIFVHAKITVTPGDELDLLCLPARTHTCSALACFLRVFFFPAIKDNLGIVRSRARFFRLTRLCLDPRRFGRDFDINVYGICMSSAVRTTRLCVSASHIIYAAEVQRAN